MVLKFLIDRFNIFWKILLFKQATFGRIFLAFISLLNKVADKMLINLSFSFIDCDLFFCQSWFIFFDNLNRFLLCHNVINRFWFQTYWGNDTWLIFIFSIFWLNLNLACLNKLIFYLNVNWSKCFYIII